MSNAPANTTWTEEEVRRFLETEDLAYQDIQLPYGLSTGGNDRSASCDMIFPKDMQGRTVLDVGCKYGYFCIEAKKRGADRVVGVDVDPESVRKARSIADCLGLDIEYRLLDVEQSPPEETFDDVLCLNVIHHLKNPIALLDTLEGLARKRLILEVASLGRHERKKLGITGLHRMVLDKFPIVVVAGKESATSGQRFFFSEKSMENLLLHQRSTFARVDTMDSEFKDRFIAVAHRRIIDRVIVVAGPTSAGKTTFIEQLTSGKLPRVAEALQLENPESVPSIDARKLKKLIKAEIDTLLFHYDLLRPYARSAKTYDRDVTLDVLHSAREVVFLTLWTPPEVLIRQLEQGEMSGKIKNGEYTGKNRRLARLHREYRDPKRVALFYRRWLDFTRGFDGAKLVAQLQPEQKVWRLDQWLETAEGRLVKEISDAS